MASWLGHAHRKVIAVKAHNSQSAQTSPQAVHSSLQQATSRRSASCVVASALLRSQTSQHLALGRNNTDLGGVCHLVVTRTLGSGSLHQLSKQQQYQIREQQPHPKQLTAWFQVAKDAVELHQLVNEYRHCLDSIHLSALLTKLAKMHNIADSIERQDVLVTAAGRQQHSTHMWLQQPSQQQQQQQQLAGATAQRHLLFMLLQDATTAIPQLQPRALCSILCALAKLQQQLEQQQLEFDDLLLLLLHRAHMQLGFASFDSRQLSMMAHALANLKAPRTNRSNQYRRSSSSSKQLWDPLLVHDLYAALGRSLYCCTAHDAAQAIYALGLLQQHPPDGWLLLWLQRAEQLLPQYTPQGLSNAAYGLAKILQMSGQLPSASRDSKGIIKHQQQQMSLQQQQYQPQAATSVDSSSRSSIRGAAVSSGDDAPLVATAHCWLQKAVQVATLHMQQLKPQELIGQLLWACGKLQLQLPEPSGFHILSRIQLLLPWCNGQLLATTLYSLAQMGQCPTDAWLASYWQALWPHISQTSSSSSSSKASNDSKCFAFGDQAVANVLWAAARLQVHIPAAVAAKLQHRVLVLTEQAGTVVSSSSHLHHHHHQVIRPVVVCLHAKVKLGWQLHPQHIGQVQAAVSQHLPGLTGRDYANILWALAAAKAKVDASWLERTLEAAQPLLPAFSSQELCCCLWSLSSLQYVPARPWLLQVLSCCLQLLSTFRPCHLAMALWALSRLGCQPSPLWLHSFWAASGPQLISFSVAELRATAVAVARLQVLPPAGWLQQFGAAVEANLADFDSSRLLDVLKVLQQLQQQLQQRPLAQGRAPLQYEATLLNSSVPFGQSHGITRSVSSLENVSQRVSDKLQMHSRVSSMPAPLKHEATVVSEAYSMACLVMLMPDWLQHRIADWPRQLAADRKARDVCSSSLVHSS